VRVLVRRASEETQTGEVIEDYAALTDTQRGHEWAPVRRWAIALDRVILIGFSVADGS
jgi:hypothetical protein